MDDVVLYGSVVYGPVRSGTVRLSNARLGRVRSGIKKEENNETIKIQTQGINRHADE